MDAFILVEPAPKPRIVHAEDWYGLLANLTELSLH